MTNRELDCVIFGFSVGSLGSLWVGYWLRTRVERWHARRADRFMKRAASRVHVAASVKVEVEPASVSGRSPPRRPPIQRIPIPTSGSRPEQDARDVLTDKERVRSALFTRQAIPLPTRASSAPHALDPASELAAETARAIHDDAVDALVGAGYKRAAAVAALVGAGYKRAAAVAALDACTLAEREGGVEQWIVAALSRARAAKT